MAIQRKNTKRIKEHCISELKRIIEKVEKADRVDLVSFQYFNDESDGPLRVRTKGTDQVQIDIIYS